MEFTLPADANKDEAVRLVRSYLDALDFNITESDTDRPWGGFFVVDESQAAQFILNFFPDFDFRDFLEYDKISPKILLVESGKRLSWQYHNRRAELWRVVDGNVGVIKSDTDIPSKLMKLNVGDKVELYQGERHRLVGLDRWGVVAEIWKHTNPENPSNEEDIIRLEDDFGR